MPSARDAEAPFALVLDDVHALRGEAAVRALRAIANDLPHRATLVLAARSEPPLPLARLRSQDLVLELGPRDLALTRAETAALLRGAGHPLDREGIEWLHQRTEGWPVGLSLAGRFLDERGAAGGVRRFGGADRLVAGYVRDEVLAGLPAGAAELLLRTSVLDTLTGPLCDALLERSGSAAILADLAGAGVLVPLDRADTRFRHHRLIAGALRTELRRTRPDLEAELHRRASAWHRGERDVDRALAHALLAGDTAGAADLVWTGVPEAVAQGRIAALERRLGRFTPEQIAGRPRLALSAAACALVLGNGHEVEHWAAAAAAVRDPAGDPAAVDAGVAVLRAAVGSGGPRQMRDDAARAAALQPQDGPWRSLCCLVSGAAQRLLGRRRRGARRAGGGGARRRGDRAARPRALPRRARRRSPSTRTTGRVRRRSPPGRAPRSTAMRLGQCPTSAVVYAVSAVVRAQRGRIDGARSDLQAAAALREAPRRLPALVRRRGEHAAVPRGAPPQRLRGRARAPRALGAAPAPRPGRRRAPRRPGRGLGPARHVRHGRRRAAVLHDGGGAPHPAVPAHPPLVPRDRRAHLRVGEHDQDAGQRRLPQADVSCRSDAVERARAWGLLDD